MRQLRRRARVGQRKEAGPPEVLGRGAAHERTHRVAQTAVDAPGEARQLGAILRRHRDERLGGVVGEEPPLSLPLGGGEELPERVQQERPQSE